MIKLTATQTTQVVVDTVRLSYVELSFDNASVRATLKYGTTDENGIFTVTAPPKMVTINSDGTVDGGSVDVDALATALSDARDAFESLILGDNTIVAAGTQTTEAVPVISKIAPVQQVKL